MQEIKLLVLDIDGTLIADIGSSIAPVDLDAIRRAQAAGVKVTIATGRILGTAKKWIGILNIDGPIITCNGADIRDLEKSYFQDNIPLHDTREILAAHEGAGVKRYLFCDNHIYCTSQDAYQRLFDKWKQGNDGVLPVTVMQDEDELFREIPGDVQQVLVWAPDGKGRVAMQEIAERFAGCYDIVRSDADNIEFNKLGVHKGKAIRKLASFYGYTEQNAMAIGDGGNDVCMLEAAGIGVAMGNAMPEAMKAADYVTSDVRSGGVAKAIDKFIFGK